MVVKDVKTEKGFRKLIVWQRAHQWVLLIYKLTEKFPKHEMFGLVSQMRRVGKVNLEGISTLARFLG